MKTGEIIKRLRKARGFCQMKLTEKIGVNYKHLKKYERGTSKIKVESIQN
ncbi:MAG: helix-turn-helix domain-containing protein [Thermodesulfovibrio sp.]|nr:helix-turn-helix domain-containing protein [Thermodesulfovibrio sp.]MCX7724217.1 helix-turn-helix domain-containing protein [Thermodesulfovibrio sp.]MDW7972618.1 helix-turn-helix transcriptional regulator [Thermodesulfovibrio sp.]